MAANSYISNLTGNYVYYKRLKTDAEFLADKDPYTSNQLLNVYSKAIDKGNIYLSNGNDRIAEVISFLQAQAKAEREKELFLLRKEFGINISLEQMNPQSIYKDLIYAYTTFKLSEEGFKRVLAKMKFGSKENKNVGMIADANFIVNKFVKIVNEIINTDYLSSIYQRAYNQNGIDNIEYNVKIILEKELNNIILQAAIQALESKVISESIWNETTGMLDQAQQINKKGYKDQSLVEELKKAQMDGAENNIIVKGFKDIYDVDGIIQELTNLILNGVQINTGDAKNKLASLGSKCKVNASKGGLMQEYVVNQAMQTQVYEINKLGKGSGVNFQAIHSGKQELKADNIYIFIDLPTQELYNIVNKYSKETKSDSVYETNVRKMEELYNKLTSLNQDALLVFENVKTGASGSQGFKGFHAGESMNLETFGNLMSYTDNTIGNVEGLIGLILQLGQGAVYENSPQLKNLLRLNISKALANFLFDDYKMIGTDLAQGNVNAIHLFNLNGIRVPLSFFLEAAADAIAQTNSASNGIFNVSFTVPGIMYGDVNLSQYTQEMWETQRIAALKNTKITVNFLKNFNKIMLDFFGSIV